MKTIYQLMLIFCAMSATYLSFKSSNQIEVGLYVTIIFAAIVCFSIEEEKNNQ